MEAAFTTTSLPVLAPNNVPDGSPDRIDALADAIGQLAGHIQAATCRLLELVAEMDRLEGWAQQGARSCAHWLSWKTSLSLPTAREYVRVAQKKDDMPLIWRAFSAGKLSYSKVRAAGAPNKNAPVAGLVLGIIGVVARRSLTSVNSLLAPSQ